MKMLFKDDASGWMAAESFYRDLEEKFKNVQLPIIIRIQMKDAYPSLTNSEIAREISDFQYEFRKYKECEIYGHKLVMQSNIGPESGSEYYHCKKCSFSGSHIYY